MYQVVYKCRLCGEAFNVYRANRKAVVETLSENCHDIWTEHKCKDGSYGIADFQGFKKVGD